MKIILSILLFSHTLHDKQWRFDYQALPTDLISRKVTKFSMNNKRKRILLKLGIIFFLGFRYARTVLQWSTIDDNTIIEINIKSAITIMI